MRHINYLLLLLMVLTICMGNGSEKTTDKKEPIVKELTSDKVTKRVLFIDTITNKIVSEFDVKANNPFNNFNYSKDEFSEGLSVTYYEINEPVKNFISKTDYYNKDISNVTVDAIKTSCFVEKINKHVMVGYIMLLLDDGSGTIGNKSKVFLFNEKGEQVFTIENEYNAIFDVEVTGDERYLSILFGGINDESLAPLLNSGFVIYDLDEQNKKSVKYFDKTLMGGSIVAFENSFVFNSGGMGGAYIIIKYDFDKKKVYSKELMLGNKRIIDITNDSVTYRDRRNKNAACDAIYFENDLNIERMSW